MDSVARSTAIDDLAKIDAHGAAVARSVHYDVRDMIDGCVMKKSVRAFLSVTKRLPVDFPPDAIGKNEFDHFLANMGKLGVRRPAGGYCRRRPCCVGPKGSACKTEAALAQRAQKGHGGPNPGIH